MAKLFQNIEYCGNHFQVICLDPLQLRVVNGCRLYMYRLSIDQVLIFEQSNYKKELYELFNTESKKFWFRPEQYTVGEQPYIGGFFVSEQNDGSMILNHTIP